MDSDHLIGEELLWLYPKRLSFGAAFILALLTAWTTGLIGSGYDPTVTKPLPFPWVLLGFFGWVLPALPVGLFWLWGWPLFYGKPTGRMRTRVAAAVIGLLSIIWFCLGWDGLTPEELRFALVTAVGSFVFAATIAVILVSTKRTDSFAWSLAANFLIFAWALTYAFPWIGETP